MCFRSAADAAASQEQASSNSQSSAQHQSNKQQHNSQVCFGVVRRARELTKGRGLYLLSLFMPTGPHPLILCAVEQLSGAT